VRLRARFSPDADDRFMTWALARGRIDTEGLAFDLASAPTDQLNELALRGEADVCAVSFGMWPALADRWLILPHGGSLGESYGPMLITCEPRRLAELAGLRVAVPGTTTTAWLVLRMIAPDLQPVVIPIVPYERIFEALARGEVDAGLVIHEGRLTYAAQGFHAVVDIGQWWAEESGGLPLPLGANVIRADLPEEVRERASRVLRASIRYGLDHQDEAIRDLLAEGGGALTTPESLRTYLGMYANERTFDYGADGLEAVDALFRRAFAAGLLPAPATARWAT
jgi:1,4-dihydroxy-6-naphthoate synthase